jgi:hypothetical protein
MHVGMRMSFVGGVLCGEAEHGMAAYPAPITSNV